jgi:hypothetical protein
MSCCQIGYVATYWPYEEMSDNMFDIINEGTVLLIMTFSTSFADKSIDPLTASDFGFIIIGMIGSNIAITFSIFIISNLKLVYQKILARFAKMSSNLSCIESLETVKLKPVNNSNQDT